MKEREKAKTEIKRDQENVSPLQKYVNQQEKTERVKAPAEQWKHASQVGTTEEMCSRISAS